MLFGGVGSHALVGVLCWWLPSAATSIGDLQRQSLCSTNMKHIMHTQCNRSCDRSLQLSRLTCVFDMFSVSFPRRNPLPSMKSSSLDDFRGCILNNDMLHTSHTYQPQTSQTDRPYEYHIFAKASLSTPPHRVPYDIAVPCCLLFAWLAPGYAAC